MGEWTLQEAMKQFLKKSPLQKGIQSVQLQEAWSEIVGQTLAKYTDHIEIKGKTLFIHTSVGALKQELLYQKKTILEKVNQRFGEIVVTEMVIR